MHINCTTLRCAINFVVIVMYKYIFDLHSPYRSLFRRARFRRASFSGAGWRCAWLRPTSSRWLERCCVCVTSGTRCCRLSRALFVIDVAHPSLIARTRAVLIATRESGRERETTARPSPLPILTLVGIRASAEHSLWARSTFSSCARAQRCSCNRSPDAIT